MEERGCSEIRLTAGGFQTYEGEVVQGVRHALDSDLESTENGTRKSPRYFVGPATTQNLVVKFDGNSNAITASAVHSIWGETQR